MPASREPWRARKPRSARPESARVNPPRPDPSLTVEIRSQSAGDRMTGSFVRGHLAVAPRGRVSWTTAKGAPVASRAGRSKLTTQVNPEQSGYPVTTRGRPRLGGDQSRG